MTVPLGITFLRLDPGCARMLALPVGWVMRVCVLRLLFGFGAGTWRGDVRTEQHGMRFMTWGFE